MSVCVRECISQILTSNTSIKLPNAYQVDELRKQDDLKEQQLVELLLRRFCVCTVILPRANTRERERERKREREREGERGFEESAYRRRKCVQRLKKV
jgi:hypothetical protein